ncbi:acyl-CoA-binding domain-containing protein 6-like [Octopus sinensis]|uniref:Acyl-CoA-binding domain-containing protein 6-like n=1 Tax=Octopus sinensis TaxID=2607531 RepID=A0A6P7ST85_9MOLL|nr:acyl-CoA-binding domain-containing protein 6-like [Octopus sinensis]
MDVNKIMSNIRNGDFEDVKRLMKTQPEKLNQTTSNGITFLMTSCERGSIRLITLSTESGTDLNISNKKNQTALHSAVDNLTKQLQVVLHSSWHLVNEAA